MRLADKVTLVTGSTSGIGRGVALGFAREGAAAVVVNYPTSAERSAAEDVVKQIETIGSQALAIEADVAAEDAVNTMIDATHERFGRIDVLVNNAGIAFTGLLQDTPADE